MKGPGRPSGEQRQDFLSVLYEALAEPIGLLISCDDPVKLRQRLYASRRAALDPDLEILQFRASPWPDEGTLIIVKSSVFPEKEISRPMPQPGLLDSLELDDIL